MPLMKSRPSPLGVPIEPTMRYTLFALPPIAVFSARCKAEGETVSVSTSTVRASQGQTAKWQTEGENTERQ